MIAWMTGLSASGKSTIARGVERLHMVEVLDGDVCRTGICAGLGFSPADRNENLRRVAHLARHLSKHTDVIVACITPYEASRRLVRGICPELRVIYVKASVDTCRERDPKGLYARADRGEIANFTGVDDTFEPPADADLVLDTEAETPADSIRRLLAFMRGPEHRYSLFIGRWQPFHLGHEHIIRRCLASGERVAIGVRDTPMDDGNIFPMPLRLETIRAAFPNEVASGTVRVFPILDIGAVVIGRNVGYAIREENVPETVAGVSATEIRRRLAAGECWQELVPLGVAQTIERCWGAAQPM